MHLVVPFAAPGSEAGRVAMKGLRWPHLSQHLALAHIDGPASDDELTLTTPAERALAEALDWDVADGLVPMARLHARADSVDMDPRGAALVTPAHWHLGTEQISMGDPEALSLDESASGALLAVVADLFTSEGFSLRYGAPTRWYLQHESLATQPTASLDRVIGRNVDRWLAAGPAARLLRRLQNELQMLLHEHPLNAERERRGLLAVNSVWISGTGPALPLPTEPPVMENSLRRAALAEDWAAWATHWALLDERLASVPWTRLTLCGERASRSATRDASAGRVRRLLTGWRRVDVRLLLEGL